MTATREGEQLKPLKEQAITEAEERAGLQRLFDLRVELPIPPNMTRLVAGYLARLESQLAEAENRPVTFVVNAAYEKLEAQLAEAQAALIAMTKDRNLWQQAHSDDCPNKIRMDALEQENGRLRAALGPVTDAEMKMYGPMYRVQMDHLLAARLARIQGGK